MKECYSIAKKTSTEPLSSSQALSSTQPVSSISNKPSSSASYQTKPPGSPSKRRRLFDYSDKNGKSSSVNSSQNLNLKQLVEKEIQNYLAIEYLNEEIGFKEFWRANKLRFPYLSKLAIKYLSVPSGTSTVERLFSQSGYINRPHRSKITAKNLEQTVLLKANMKYINN